MKRDTIIIEDKAVSVTGNDVWMTATALLNEAGQVYAIATTERAQDGKPARESGRGS